MRFLVNLLATFVLVLLLVTPGVFSTNLVGFRQDGVVISNQSSKFGKFLKLSQTKVDGGIQFQLEFTKFTQPALFAGILEVENTTEGKVRVEIVNPNSNLEVFFDTGSQIAGPGQFELSTGEKVKVNLLVYPENQVDYSKFILKLN